MPNQFIKAALECKARGNKAIARRIMVEGRIVSKLISHALASGYVVSLNDGEEWVVKRSSSKAELLDAAFSTDMDYLSILDPRNVPDPSKPKQLKRFGTVTLIYGNDGFDVISDYASSDLDAFSAWIKPVEAYAEELELGGLKG